MDIVKDFFLTDRYLLLKNAVAVVGLVCVAVFTWKQLRLLCGALWAYVMTPLTRKNLKKYGSWAVVTGASDGIGKAYCYELAQQGLNVVLMSRSKGKLDAVAEELRSQFNVETKVIVVDFTGGKDIYTEIGPQLMGLDIGVLVNNVGMAGSGPSYFADLQSDEVWNLMVCNMAAMTMMTHIVLPGMVKKNKGVIVNVSAGFGRYPAAYMTIYSAAKSYADFFSQALAREYGSKGIIVQSLLPHGVVTNMTKEFMKSPTLFAPSAATFVKSAVGTVGILNRTTGYWPHSFQIWVVDYIVPLWLTYRSIDKFMRGKALEMKEKKKTQ